MEKLTNPCRAECSTQTLDGPKKDLLFMTDTTQNFSNEDFNTPLNIPGVTPDMIKTALSDDFKQLLDDNMAVASETGGDVVKGIIAGIEGDMAVVDIGMKAEGRIPLKEFIDTSKPETTITVGDTVEVYVESLDDRNGEAVLSREKAKREGSLDELEDAYNNEKTVKGIIFGRVKGGFMVDVQGALAFLPGSQVDVRPIRDMGPLMNTPLDFQILKMDRPRANIIVSRRAIMDESRAEAREEIMQDMHEGKVLEGVVKNITDYGAFVDMGGVDGLLHITDIAWHRINHPSEVLSLGQTIEAQVIRFNEETKRISLGLKQLQDDPWTKVDSEYSIGNVVKGTITNITDYGAFVELEPGIEGLIHVSEMSWTRKNVHPSKMLSTSQEVDVMVLEVDHDKRRISLGLKQCQANPWDTFAEEHPEGSDIEGTVRNVTDFGVFVGLTEEIDGLIHMSDISWEGSGESALSDFKKGDTVNARVLSIDPDKERVSLGIKQLSEDPGATIAGSFKKGKEVSGTVVEVNEDSLVLDLGDDVRGVVDARDLARNRAAQNTSQYDEGDKVNAKVLRTDRSEGVVRLSVKALDIEEEKKAVKAYSGKSEGSASLGDVLGEALQTSDKKASDSKKAPAKKTAAKKADTKAPAKKTTKKAAEDKAEEKSE